MKASDSIKILKQKFTSSNDIPVTQATITLEEFKALELLMLDLLEFREDMDAGVI